MLTMQFLLLDMALKTERTIGLLRTHGEKLGVIKDSSKLREELTCAELLSAILSQQVLKKSILNFSCNEKIVIYLSNFRKYFIKYLN